MACILAVDLAWWACEGAAVAPVGEFQEVEVCGEVGVGCIGVGIDEVGGCGCKWRCGVNCHEERENDGDGFRVEMHDVMSSSESGTVRYVDWVRLEGAVS